jgi:predicted nucleotidyltransferase
MKIKHLIKILKKNLNQDKEILFAYLYGSYACNAVHPRSDIDIAVYLQPASIKEYIKKEKELTSVLTAKLHLDKIDLRILNTLPILLKYKVIKEGMPILIKDKKERVDFETMVMNRFFEIKPYLNEYNRMLSLRIKSGV